MARLDDLLARLSRERRRVAAFGLSEVFWLCRAYSSLGDFPLAGGLDDEPEKPEYGRLGFPVRTPEACRDLGVQDVLLTMNRLYHDGAARRLERLGLVPHPVLSASP
jgi:hypothetical protein